MKIFFYYTRVLGRAYKELIDAPRTHESSISFEELYDKTYLHEVDKLSVATIPLIKYIYFPSQSSSHLNLNQL